MTTNGWTAFTGIVDQCSGEALEGKGRSGILPEMVNAGCCNDYFFSPQLDLVHTARQDKNVPKEWADAVLAYTHPKERRSWHDN